MRESDFSSADLIDGWWRYQRLAAGARPERLAADEWFWAPEEVERMIQFKDERVVATLVGLAEAGDSPSDMELVGAGPIESFLTEHGLWLATTEGSASLEEMANFSRTSSSFRHALGNVWYEDHELPTDVRNRLQGLPAAFGSGWHHGQQDPDR